jgi:hypothetical protein
MEGSILTAPSRVFGSDIVLRVVGRAGKAVCEIWTPRGWEVAPPGSLVYTLPGKSRELSASEIEAAGITD